MPAWIYADGHLGWTLFAVLVYTLLAMLVVDYAWRRVTISVWRLLGVAGAIWLAGAVLLVML